MHGNVIEIMCLKIEQLEGELEILLKFDCGPLVK